MSIDTKFAIFDISTDFPFFNGQIECWIFSTDCFEKLRKDALQQLRSPHEV